MTKVWPPNEKICKTKNNWIVWLNNEIAKNKKDKYRQSKINALRFLNGDK
jgi:hypothetical protein